MQAGQAASLLLHELQARWRLTRRERNADGLGNPPCLSNASSLEHLQNSQQSTLTCILQSDHLFYLT